MAKCEVCEKESRRRKRCPTCGKLICLSCEMIPYEGHIDPYSRPTQRAVDLKPAAVVKVKRIVASNH
jgi:hypothetical protein